MPGSDDWASKGASHVPFKIPSVFLIVFFVAAASAQTTAGGSATVPEAVGKVSFTTSCTVEFRP